MRGFGCGVLFSLFGIMMPFGFVILFGDYWCDLVFVDLFNWFVCGLLLFIMGYSQLCLVGLIVSCGLFTGNFVFVFA